MNTLSKLERGLATGVSKGTLDSLDSALGWVAGHAARVRARPNADVSIAEIRSIISAPDPARIETRARALDLAIRAVGPLALASGINGIAAPTLQLAARYDAWIRNGRTDLP